ncbi:isoprenyl transferase [Ichthyobacterium seriolicida]|uniref:Isoprenyl transferase n=1 Tax=Ichthyobacterium seriolicida TaxID=242600 RepID=A0A1J1DY80_9FLAO|nr:isoprenyl transferase [Ichthyobacterium seriolicida]BAV94839.1 undecaprenyl pyrophosphate synthetase [Ichthyobacterium seriolicida]
MEKNDTISNDNMPRHLAIIMDGNGRWAEKRGLFRVLGHKNGVKTVRHIVEVCCELGIKYVSLYAFSLENWNRPKSEVSKLMDMLRSWTKKELQTFQENNVKLNVIGNLDRLPADVSEDLKMVVEKTSSYDRMILTIAVSYSSRMEIVDAAKTIASDVSSGKIKVEDIDDVLFGKRLYTKDLPDVDLLIRTSGEQRVSNFLLWQISYAELYFTSVLWPDFKKTHLLKALQVYSNRNRRFGKLSEE